jgi:AbrB family looped-hinge helix DNA binding protein
MVKIKQAPTGCSLSELASCCKVEALIAVDDRGQMVLPKDIRDRANIKPGDKLALISWEKNGAICCLNLIKADELGGMVKNILGPMMTDLSQK